MTKSKDKINLQLSVEEAREAYNDPNALKKVLESNFGKSVLVLDVCERVKSIDDAFEETGDPRSFRDATEEMQTFLQSTYEAAILAKALNEGERMNIYNRSNRYYPYWACNGSPSGFGFDISYCDCDVAFAGSGSRLSFKERRLSNHAAEIAKETYRTMLDS